MGGVLSQNEKELNNEQIIIKDLPYRIQGDLTKKDVLHRSIGALMSINRYKQIQVGSGVLLSKDIVLTAAHNIFDRRLRHEFSGFKFFVESNGVGEEYYQADQWRFPQQFKTCKSSQTSKFDYAILKIRKNKQFNNFLPLSIPCSRCLTSNREKQLNLFGFPKFQNNYQHLDKNGQKMVMYQYGFCLKDRILNIDVDQHKISYQIQTLPGCAGCPVVIDQAVIAIHLGRQKDHHGIGRIVDLDLINNVLQWIRQLKAAPIKISKGKACNHTQDTKQILNWPLRIFKNIEFQMEKIIPEMRPQRPEVNKPKQLKYTKEQELFSRDHFRNKEQMEFLQENIVAIRSFSEDQSFGGTGVMLTSKIVLTCAHNVFCRQSRRNYNFIKVYFSSKGISDQVFEVQSIRYPHQFKVCNDQQRLRYDYALLKLTRQVKHKQFMSLQVSCSACLLANNSVNELKIYGFPSIFDNYEQLSKYDEDNITLKVYGESKKKGLLSVQSYAIAYRIEASMGQSGSPIILNNSIIGIHCGTQRQRQSFNIGRLITPELCSILKNWCIQLKCNPCKFLPKSQCSHPLSTIPSSMTIITNYRNSKQKIMPKELNRQIPEIIKPRLPSQISIRTQTSKALGFSSLAIKRLKKL